MDDPRGHSPNRFGPVVGEGEINSEGHSKTGGLSKELVYRYEGLHHNTGVFTVEDGKLGSLLSCLAYADIFWPPPSWLNQARSDALVSLQNSHFSFSFFKILYTGSLFPSVLA